MGAEYELKYRADAECLESVFTTFPARWQTIQMETTYYDTPTGALSARWYTLRRRLERAGGTMTVQAFPYFKLTVTVPKGKEGIL